MQVFEIQEMHRQEENYWWHVGRRLVLDRVLSKFFSKNDNRQILDIGCGSGANFAWLNQFGKITGLDSNQVAVDFCRSYGQAILGDALKLPFPSQSFDLVTAFDVLEHLPDDKQALQEWNRSLKSTGYVFITVPAYQWLFSAHDRALNHVRRYSASELSYKLRQTGFDIKFISPFFFFTFPAVLMVRLFTKNSASRASYTTTGNFISQILIGLSKIEAWYLSHGGKFPWGSSILVLAQKINASK